MHLGEVNASEHVAKGNLGGGEVGLMVAQQLCVGLSPW